MSKQYRFILSVALLVAIHAAKSDAQSGTRVYTQPAQGSGTRSTYAQPSQGSASRSTMQGSATRAQTTFEDRFWQYLKRAQYQNWAPLPGLPDMYDGQSPHGAKVKVFANRAAATASGGQFPHGSILVKENYEATGQQLKAITVMYRSKGFAPDVSDWYWVKYEPSGMVALDEGRRIRGRVSSCIECHQSAGGGDYVFKNDQ